MSKQNENNAAPSVTSKTIHRQLQAIAAEELEKIPEYLAQLTPAERVRFILAILPFTAPRVETVDANYGQPLSAAWGDFD